MCQPKKKITFKNEPELNNKKLSRELFPIESYVVSTKNEKIIQKNTF